VASGSRVGQTVSPYALNRQTLAAVGSHPGNWSVTPATGLTVSWPLGAKQQNYTGWVNQTQTTTTLKYVKQAQQGGINTYVYHATVSPTPIKNTQLLAGLPKSLPVSLLPAMHAAGLISAANLTSLSKLFPGAASIPLGYTYQANDTYYVAPGTGLVVNVSNNEAEMAGIALPQGKIIPVLPVLSYTYHASPASLSAAVNDAMWRMPSRCAGRGIAGIRTGLTKSCWFARRTRCAGLAAAFCRAFRLAVRCSVGAGIACYWSGGWA
jgi:hypothetical protein